MDRLQDIVTIPKQDILAALDLTAQQLDKRIAEGIYPEPERRNRQRKFTLGWLHIAQIRESEYKLILTRMVLNKEKRHRLDTDIKDILSL